MVDRAFRAFVRQRPSGPTDLSRRIPGSIGLPQFKVCGRLRASEPIVVGVTSEGGPVGLAQGGASAPTCFA